jgi:hypothetical protein
VNWLWYLAAALIIGLFVLLSTSSGSYLRLLYGKPVFTDSSAQECAKVEAALKAADVRYSMETIKSVPTYMKGRYAQDYMRFNMPQPAQDGNTPLFVYRIYVPRIYRAEAERVLSNVHSIR